MSSAVPLPRPLWFERQWCCALLALVLVVLFYGAALGFDLVWDDQTWLNEFRRHDLTTLLKGNLTGHTLVSYYRPLVVVVLNLQLALSQNPLYLHGFNLALHWLNLLLLILLAQRPHSTRPPLWLPLAVTVLAIHPVLVEPVVWVSGRFDLFYTSFLLLTLLLAVRLTSPLQRFVAVTLTFLAALLCKESALAYVAVGPVLLAQMARATPGLERRAVFGRAAGHLAALLSACALYLALRVGYLQLPLVKNTAFALQANGGDGNHLVLILRTLGTYLQMTLVPLWNLAPLHDMSGTEATVYGYAGVGAVAVALALAALRWPVFLPFSVWVLALAPAANLLPFRLDLVQDRYLYFPIFAALLTMLHGPLPRHVPPSTRRMLGLLAALWLCALAVTTLSITRFWRDSVALFSWTVTARPDSNYALENLALAHLGAGNYAKAIAIESRIPTATRSFQGRLVLARATREQGDFSAAVGLYKDALAVPAFDDAMTFGATYELALVYRQLGDEAASAAQAASAEALAERQQVSARLREYYRREMAKLR